MATKSELEIRVSDLESEIHFTKRECAQAVNDFLGTNIATSTDPERIVEVLIDEMKDLMLKFAELRPVYRRPVWREGEAQPHVEYWYDEARYNEPARVVGKQLYVRNGN